jgi:hypothetical protein
MTVRRKLLYGALALTSVFLMWLAADLFGPAQSDLRQFDPVTVARLETDMWRSYYDREQVQLFFQLARMLRTQYRVPFARSIVIAFRGAKAAFIFKDGKARPDYERALPDLQSYYGSLRRMSSSPFDVDEAARLELEWWIIHRDRARHTRQALDDSLAALQAEIYGMPVERFQEHARLRAEAMLLRDDKWEAGGVTESDWTRIYELLLESWRDLAVQVQGVGSSRK